MRPRKSLDKLGGCFEVGLINEPLGMSQTQNKSPQLRKPPGQIQTMPVIGELRLHQIPPGNEVPSRVEIPSVPHRRFAPHLSRAIMHITPIIY